ncbi:MAG TPA: D-alanyl-D-alanine carboxypeptidase/D-alanyl-D-alanine-endopeptidase [Candidatus Rubrimentiphilum sp.]|nr:D-alanyl-D-alanine carboxypeptidase/D-alanyl-D-alanine-endopeptidase [Candidatus Rubrimentiphilum sp.]
MQNTAGSRRSSKPSRALSCAPAVFVALLAACGHASAPSKPPVAAPQRTPAPAWGSAAKSDLQNTIRQALSPALARAYDWSCAVIAEDGTLLYDDHSTRAVVPASAQKLIVGDVVLTRLRPHYRFHTLLAAAEAPRDGTIGGDLWLVGSGDPSLRSDDLRRGVTKMQSAGLRAVTGGVAVDGSALAGAELNPHWNPGDANEDFMAAISGVSIDEDTVEFRIAGTSAGQPAQVRIKPQSAAVIYYGSIATGNADDVIVAATGTPNVFRLAGTIPPGVREIFYLPVHGIPHYAGTVLTRFLRDAQITVARGPSVRRVPQDAAILWDHPSPELMQLVHHMMIFSDNHFAEQFLRALGASAGGPADDATGLATERAVLRGKGIPTPGLHLVDGSGLSDANRVAAITLARILAMDDLYPMLARGGLDGTLKWYHFAQANGRVRAKSGHLSSVSSLAGYVNTRRHGRVVFAFLINGPPDPSDRAIVAAVDRIAQR